MSMVEKFIRLYAWRANYQEIQVIQGEAGSREFNIQLINTTAPVDLTGTSVKLFGRKSDDTKIYIDCIINDEQNGLVSVILTDQMAAIDGKVECWIQVMGQNGKDLRFEGLVIDVSDCDLNNAVQSQDDYSALVAAVQGSQKAAKEAEAMANKASDFANAAERAAEEAGKSAYDLWLEQGNTGTVADFLESLVGEPGPSGPPGADGKTPVRGTDYWTASDKTEIVNSVLNSLTAAEGVVS